MYGFSLCDIHAYVWTWSYIEVFSLSVCLFMLLMFMILHCTVPFFMIYIYQHFLAFYNCKVLLFACNCHTLLVLVGFDLGS